MFKKIPAWWTARQERKRQKLADDRWISPAEMDQVQRKFGPGHKRVGAKFR